MARVFNTKLQRVIGQIRFRPTLTSFHSAPLVAKELEDSYEEWRAVKSDDITLYSPAQKKLLQVTSDMITYLSEQEINDAEIAEQIEAILSKSIELTFISQIRRIGFRNTQVIQTPFNFDEIVDLIYKKFYSQEEPLKSLSTDTPRDVVFVLDGQKNGFLNHVQIGPVKLREAIRTFDNTFDISEGSITDDKNIYLDVDVSMNSNLNVESTIEKLKQAIEENNRIVSEYLKYLSS